VNEDRIGQLTISIEKVPCDTVIVEAAGTDRHKHALDILEEGYVAAMYDGNGTPSCRLSS
jgi:hypothetical protein